MKIALAQINIEWENKEDNISKCIDCIKLAKSNGADGIFFPEMTLTGFSMNTSKTAENDGYTINIFKRISVEYEMCIGVGFVVDKGDKSENHYAIIDRGNVLIDYSKIHPFSYSGEDEYFQGGNEIFISQYNDFKIGCAICYDLRFPEIFQGMSKDAGMIFVPANWPERRSEHWKLLLRARALENQCYIAGINCCGMMYDNYYSGDSGLYNPNGDEVKPYKQIKPFENREDIVYLYTVDNDIDMYRNSFPVKKDRKNRLYSSMLNNM